MANITEEHLHHMAKRHHATMKVVDGFREKAAATAQRFFSTFETGAGAWLGGALEGKTGGYSVMNVPLNLGIGGVLLAVAHFDLAGKDYSGHINNLANGFIGSYAAATGYAFGKNWKETGKLWGGHSWSRPYGEVPPAVHGDLSEAQMAAIVQRMQAAAAAPHG